MIRGMHAMFYSSQPEELRAFLRDQLGLPHTDVGGGWLIFDVPEGDVGVHPVDPEGAPPSGTHDVSFYCDDIAATVSELKARGVDFTDDVSDRGYGLVIHFEMPGGVKAELYQPRYDKSPSPASGASTPRKLSKHPVHLGLGATAVGEPEFTGSMDWYSGYGARHADDGEEGRLVSMCSFDASWDSWEMHPKGSELVLCTAGRMTLVQEIDGDEVRTELRPGQYAINEPGVWHTADVEGSATAVFITAGMGTQHRER